MGSVDDSLQDIKRKINDLRIESRKLYYKTKELGKSNAITNRLFIGMIALFVFVLCLCLSEVS